MGIEELRRSFDRLWMSSKRRNTIPGRLGKPDGDGTFTVRVTTRPGYAYVRLGPEGTEGITTALNLGVPYHEDLPVDMQRLGSLGPLVIVGVDGSGGRLEQFIGGGSNTYNVAPHTHEIGSGLEYEVEALRLEPGRLRYFSGMEIYINPFRYIDSNGNPQYWAGGTLDLTSNMPATAGNWAWVLVGINRTNNTAVAVTGDEYSYQTPLTPDLLDDIVFTGYEPCGAIRIREDDTVLNNIERYLDAHIWFGGGGEAAAVPEWFNVEDYGAVHDSVTDDTTAIQDTIDAAAAAGGGVVYFPAGIYIIGGALQDTGASNAQLLLPEIDRDDDDPIAIHLLGEHPPYLNTTIIGGLNTPAGGSILKGTLNSGAGGAMFGVENTGSSGWPFSKVTVKFENLTIRMPNNPVLTALNLEYVSAVELYNLELDIGSMYVDDVTEPTTSGSYGVIMPILSNGGWSYVNALSIVGFYNGIKLGEHCNVKQMNVLGCKNAIVIEGGNHPALIDRVMVHWSEVGIKFITRTAWIRINQFNNELYNTSIGGAKWYEPVYDIDDSNNYGKGFIEYRIVRASTGATEAITVNGGTNLELHEIGDPIIGGSGGHTIQDDDTPLTDRTNLNFVDGSGVSIAVTDDAGDDATDVTPALDLPGLTEELTIDGVNDEVVFYDDSASAHRKIPPWRFQASSRLIYSQTDNMTIANTTDETTLLGNGRGTLVLPANSVIAGTVLNLTSFGNVSSTGVPTGTIKMYLGGEEIASGVATFTGLTDANWIFHGWFVVRTTGATGTAQAGGLIDYDDGTVITLLSASDVTIDTTVDMDVDLTFTWSAASASNDCHSHWSSVMVSNPPPWECNGRVIFSYYRGRR